MSIRIMSAIFDTEFRDLPLPPQDGEDKPRMAKATSIKITMLALADHANDDGECYPGFTKLELKTGLSRQGVVDVLSAIKYNGLAFVADEPSKKGSNFYTINLQCFPRLTDKNRSDLLVKPLDYLEGDWSSHLTSASQVTLPEVVKPLDLNHQLTDIKPPLDEEQKSSPAKNKVPENYSDEWKILAGEEITGKRDERAAKMIDTANLIAMGMRGVDYHVAYGVAYAFMETRGIVIPESKIKGQRKPLREMIESGVLPNHAQEATKKLMSANMTVTDLYSISRTAIDLANKAGSKTVVVEVDDNDVPVSY